MNNINKLVWEAKSVDDRLIFIALCEDQINIISLRLVIGNTTRNTIDVSVAPIRP